MWTGGNLNLWMRLILSVIENGKCEYKMKISDEQNIETIQTLH